MKEILILSGKGGTGKTSIVGAMAHLAPSKVIADCDVDASDLHLLLSPKVIEKHDFFSGAKARVRADACTGCGYCEELCQFGAVTTGEVAEISQIACEGCGVCSHFCPESAIDLEKNHCGMWYVSDTDYGTLVHSQLFAGEENSGKLVTLVKNVSRQLAVEKKVEFLFVDGAPGVGCPVIASLANVDLVLVVTEPTLSGQHDLERILRLTSHFKVPSVICINKWDLHPELSVEIEAKAKKNNVDLLARIPFDPVMIDCQIKGIPVTVSETSLAAWSLKKMWERLQEKVALLDREESGVISINFQER